LQNLHELYKTSYGYSDTIYIFQNKKKLQMKLK
jgi:hypothetical protein